VLLAYATSPARLDEQLIAHQLPPEQAQSPEGELTYATVPESAAVHFGSPDEELVWIATE
jgi:hypothetical protein